MYEVPTAETAFELARKKCNILAIEKHSKKDSSLNSVSSPHTFLLRKKSTQKSSRNGFEPDRLSGIFPPLNLALKMSNSHTLRQRHFLNEPNRAPVSSADFSKKSQAVTHLFECKRLCFYNSATPHCENWQAVIRFYIFRKVYILYVRPLIPAELPECNLLTGESAGSYF